MAETSSPWDGITQGDATRAPYNASEWDDQYEDMFNSDVNRGVLANRGNELVGSIPGANQFRIASGAALVKGKWYKNDANVNFAPLSASGGNWRRDRIVLSSTWTNINSATRDPAVQLGQTIRLIRLINPVENAAAPAITQIDGTLWEIPLYQIDISDAGVVTIYADDREFIRHWREVIQYFVPCTGGIDESAVSPLEHITQRGMTLVDAADCYGYGQTLVPNDFVSNFTTTPVVISHWNAGDIYCSMTAYYGQCNESYLTHSNATVKSAVSIMVDRHECIKELLLPDAAVGDLVHLQFFREATHVLDTVNQDVELMGWIIEYVARHS